MRAFVKRAVLLEKWKPGENAAQMWRAQKVTPSPGTLRTGVPERGRSDDSTTSAAQFMFDKMNQKANLRSPLARQLAWVDGDPEVWPSVEFAGLCGVCVGICVERA